MVATGVLRDGLSLLQRKWGASLGSRLHNRSWVQTQSGGRLCSARDNVVALLGCGARAHALHMASWTGLHTSHTSKSQLSSAALLSKQLLI